MTYTQLEEGKKLLSAMESGKDFKGQFEAVKDNKSGVRIKVTSLNSGSRLLEINLVESPVFAEAFRMFLLLAEAALDKAIQETETQFNNL